MNEALSPSQLQRLHHDLTGRPVRVVAYDDVIHSKDLQDLFRGQPSIIIFYPQLQHEGTTFGHYVCLIHHQLLGQISYYDPLAYLPDEYKKFSVARHELYPERYNSLIAHLLASGFDIDYNNHQHQSRRVDVATCGRHCVIRSGLHELTNDQYHATLGLVCPKERLKDRLILSLTERQHN